MSILYIYIYIYYGPEPHWGTVRKKMAPDKVYLSQVYYRIFQYVMITRSLSRWHSRSSAWLGSISNASTT